MGTELPYPSPDLTTYPYHPADGAEDNPECKGNGNGDRPERGNPSDYMSVSAGVSFTAQGNQRECDERPPENRADGIDESHDFAMMEPTQAKNPMIPNRMHMIPIANATGFSGNTCS
jgi:hypothetical protein